MTAPGPAPDPVTASGRRREENSAAAATIAWCALIAAVTWLMLWLIAESV